MCYNGIGMFVVNMGVVVVDEGIYNKRKVLKII